MRAARTPASRHAASAAPRRAAGTRSRRSRTAACRPPAAANASTRAQRHAARAPGHTRCACAKRALLVARLQRRRRRAVAPHRAPAARLPTQRHAHADDEEHQRRDRRGLQLGAHAAELPGAEIAADEARAQPTRARSASDDAAAPRRRARAPRPRRAPARAGRRRVSPSTRSSACSVRRRATSSACVENTRNPPVNSATSASTLRFTRYERERFALVSARACGGATFAPGGSARCDRDARRLDVDPRPQAQVDAVEPPEPVEAATARCRCPSARRGRAGCPRAGRRRRAAARAAGPTTIAIASPSPRLEPRGRGGGEQDGVGLEQLEGARAVLGRAVRGWITSARNGSTPSTCSASSRAGDRRVEFEHRARHRDVGQPRERGEQRVRKAAAPARTWRSASPATLCTARVNSLTAARLMRCTRERERRRRARCRAPT